MSVTHTLPSGRFYRNADKALLGGVCAGIADYLGFNLKVTRFLAFIAFLMAMPVAVIGYFAVVFLVPSVSSSNGEKPGLRKCRKRRGKKASKSQPAEPTEATRVAGKIDAKCRDMDRRLARLEQHVTSKRFQLEQELRNL